MRPAGELFLRTLRQSHVIAAAVDLYFPDAPTVPVPVPVEAGTVTIDRTARNRRAGNVTIPWSLAADLDVDLRTLTLGGYACVYRGVRYGDGTPDLILLGRLRVESVTWDTLQGTATLELTDRMAQVGDEPFTAPYPAKGLRPHVAAWNIVTQVFGSTIAYTAPYQPAGLIGDVIYSGQRTDALSALEQSYGAETYFDANGDFVFARKPEGGTPPVWTVDAGDAGVMVGALESLDRTGVYNGVYVTGQDTADTPPVSALAIFTDPASPVRWGGPFGKVALLAESTSAATAAEAKATARSLLNLRLKQTRNLTITSAPNPALEAGDPITVRFPDGREEPHMIDAVTHSLSTDPQQIVTRTLFAPVADTLTGPAMWRELEDATAVPA